jgi:hypothetical protein
MKCLGDSGFYLVLDSDVETWARLILGDQEPAKIMGQFIADGQKFRAVDAICHSPAQHHDSGKMRDRRWALAYQRRQPRFDFGQVAWRQVVEQSDMRVEEVALGREMLRAQAVGPRLIGLAHFGGDDDGGGHPADLAVERLPETQSFVILNLFQDSTRRWCVILKQVQDDVE